MSDKTIAQKLMVKPGHSVLFVNAPQDYSAAIGALPPQTTVLETPSEPVDVIQVFIKNRRELEEQLPRLKPLLKPKGILWVTYYKGTSKTKTDINRDRINEYAGTLGMEGVAIFSVDSDWAALRLKVR
jgi:predicted CoA-binding protein